MLDNSCRYVYGVRINKFKRLSGNGGEIAVEIIIRGHKADGFSESTARVVRENSVQLGLDLDMSD